MIESILLTLALGALTTVLLCIAAAVGVCATVVFIRDEVFRE
jgi:hypothetical protein